MVKNTIFMPQFGQGDVKMAPGNPKTWELRSPDPGLSTGMAHALPPWSSDNPRQVEANVLVHACPEKYQSEQTEGGPSRLRWSRAAHAHHKESVPVFPAPNFFPSSPLPAWLIWMTKLLFLSEIVRWRIVLCASYCVVKGKEHGKSCIRILYKKYCVSHIPWHSWVHIYCLKWV